MKRWFYETKLWALREIVLWIIVFKWNEVKWNECALAFGRKCSVLPFVFHFLLQWDLFLKRGEVGDKSGVCLSSCRWSEILSPTSMWLGEAPRPGTAEFCWGSKQGRRPGREEMVHCGFSLKGAEWTWSTKAGSFRTGARRRAVLVSCHSYGLLGENEQVQAIRPSAHVKRAWPFPWCSGYSRHLKRGEEPMIPQFRAWRVSWRCGRIDFLTLG